MGDLLIMSKIELRRKSIFDLVKIGQITRLDASKRLYISYRQTKRMYQRYLKEGDAGLIHRSRGKPSKRSYPYEIKKAALALYEEKYWDFGPTLAAEKLLEEDNLKLQISFREEGNIGEKEKRWFWQLPEKNVFEYEDLEEKPFEDAHEYRSCSTK